MDRKIYWQEMRRGEIGEAAEAGGVVIIPIGAMEQHGPHLPVNTDTSTVLEIARRAAERVTEFPVIIAPPIWTGYSPEQMDFPGTISLSAETFMSLVVEVGTSIAHSGFKKIFLLNGHGGNRGLVFAITTKLGEAGVMAASATYWDMITEEINQIREGPVGSMGHSCELETSTQLWIQPENVDMSQAVVNIRAKGSRYFSRDMVEVHRVFYPPIAIRQPGRAGVSGDPSTATAEKGDKFLEAAAEAVATFLREYHAF